jgi:hypothetical protein
METTRELSLRDKIRRALIEGVPEASEEDVERALNRIMTGIDPFERTAVEVLARYDRTFADLAKMTQPRWLSVEEVIRLHEIQIHRYGGWPGTRV